MKLKLVLLLQFFGKAYQASHQSSKPSHGNVSEISSANELSNSTENPRKKWGIAIEEGYKEKNRKDNNTQDIKGPIREPSMKSVSFSGNGEKIDSSSQAIKGSSMKSVSFSGNRGRIDSSPQAWNEKATMHAQMNPDQEVDSSEDDEVFYADQ